MTQSPAERPDLALFLPSFDKGGVERMLTQLALGLSGLGVRLDFVIRQRRSGYLDRLPDNIRVVELGPGGDAQAAARYLAEVKPRLLLSSKDENNVIALEAKRLSGAPTQVWLRSAIAESSRVSGQFFWKRWKAYRVMRQTYPAADGVIAVSRDLARDLAQITGMPETRIHVVANPVVTPEMQSLAAQPVEHPWFGAGQPPVIVGVGRLARVKNFALLLQAFARVRRAYPARLMILGEGRERGPLEKMAAKLGLGDDFALPGYVANPYAYVSRSRLFVLSSLSEGSPNALTEALALGVPSVATDCLSGPREILQDGRYGPLVPVNDVSALAEAMLKTLENPLSSGVLREAAEPFTVEKSARAYAAVLGLPIAKDMP